LIDRPVISQRLVFEKHGLKKSPCEHCAPVCRSGQGVSDHSLASCGLNALLSCLGVCHGPVKSKERRTRTRERRVQRRLTRIGTRSAGRIVTHQMTLEITQGGMNRKDDLFEVVFYPGADKREKGILGEILLRSLIEVAGILFEAFLIVFEIREVSFRYAEDTGGARLSM
jgi:hypothetical protein